MAELDVEKLKQETYWGNVIGYRSAIIAALEDRDRLRAALITYGDHIYPICPALHGGLCDCGWAAELATLPERAALEGHDG